MKRLPVFALFLLCAAGQLAAQVMPPWLTPYPGGSPETKRTNTTVESSYTVGAAPKDVLAHFQKLFDAQGIPIDSIGAPEGFYLHAEPAECNFDIAIVHGDKGTAVKVTCASKAGAAPPVILQQPAPEETGPEPPKKPGPAGGKTGVPALVWPKWMTRVDGSKLAGRKLGGQFRGAYGTAGPARDILSFYLDLLNAHDYQVSEVLPTAADDYGNSLVATSEPDLKAGKKTVIRVKVRPAGGNLEVEITMQ
jgi:hypothetical protein